MRLLLAAALICAAVPAMAQAQKQDQPVIHMVVPLPAALPEPEAKPEMICREPGTQSGSKIVGRKVCKTAKEWNALHARGLDAGADGKTRPLSSTTNPLACGSRC